LTKRVTAAAAPAAAAAATPALANMVSSMSLRVAVSLPRLCISLVGGPGPGGDETEELVLATLDSVFASIENQRPYTSFDLRVQEIQVRLV
jgi:hypothetical protein